MAVVDLKFGLLGKSMVTLLVLVFMVTFIESSQLPIPLFIWKGQKSDVTLNQHVKLGQTLLMDDVNDKYIKPLLDEPNHTYVVFVQDELSIDDVSRFSNSGAFNSLKKELSESPSVVLPSVKLSAKDITLMKYLKTNVKGSKEEVFSSDIDEWNIDPESSKTLFIFHLSPVHGSSDDEKAKLFAENDARIERIMKVIRQRSSHFTAILTAQSPSKFVQNHVQNDGVEDEYLETNTRRHLLSHKTINGGQLFNMSGCILMYATSIKFKIGSTSNQTVDLIGYDADVTGDCAKDNTHLTIAFKNFNASSKVTKLSITINLGGNSSYVWSCVSLVVDYAGSLSGSTEEMTLHSNCTGMQAPRNRSFACGEPSYPFANSTVLLTMDSFQIQPFLNSSRTFGPVSDCTPFFTIPILTGIFASVVLLSVVFLGLTSIMMIQATDRFDDPKAPSIHVAHEG